MKNDKIREAYLDILANIKSDYEDHKDEEAKNCLTYAINTILNQQSTIQVLNHILDEIKKLHKTESKTIEDLPEDLNFHLWVRRGLILSQKIIQEEIDKINECM